MSNGLNGPIFLAIHSPMMIIQYIGPEIEKSQVRVGTGLCPWARHFIHIAQTAEVRDALPMWHWG